MWGGADFETQSYTRRNPVVASAVPRMVGSQSIKKKP
jgi:hypothetical protein